MGLNRLKVKLTTAPLTKDGMPTIAIEGDLVKQYNDADARIKAAERVKEELKPDLVDAGIDEIFQRNCANPAKPIKTVKLVDEENEGLQVQFTASYGPAVPEAVEKVFRGLTGDADAVNQYVVEVAFGTWAKTAFLDVDGKFDKRKYDAYRLAVEAVAVKFGEDCPLSVAKAVIPLATFHDRRWTDFPEVRLQKLIKEVLPNTVRLVPVRKEGTK